MKNSNRIRTFLSIFFLIGLAGALAGQGAMVSIDGTGHAPEPEKKSIFDTWVEEGQLELTIKTDFEHLIASKNKDKYQKAELVVTNTSGAISTTSIKIKARGKFRRKICDFPPLKVNFNKEDLKQSGLESKFDKFKLVTHCADSEEDEQNVLKEYLAYKLYNQLTPKSYQVKLVKVNYVDEPNGNSFEKYAFMLESTKELAERLGGKEIEGYNIPLDTLRKIDSQVLSMFQYMIGNTDWKTKVMHNIKIIQPENGGKLIMVPYDFDFSGMVNATYARPNVNLRQANVRDRVYMDKVDDLKALEKVIRYFKGHEKPLYAIVDELDPLKKKNRRDVIRFLKSFYSILEDEMLSNQAFVKQSL